MSLLDKFKIVKPRENSGSMASNRFDFQKNWAICKLIELLSNGDSDFLLAFEYHEDIILLDSSSNPSQIDFFQIKTKNKGAYTLNEILKRKKLKTEDSGSILGKLFINRTNFNDETNSLNIVSNTSFKPSGISSGTFCCNQLNDNEKKEIEKSLESELGIRWLEEFLDIIFFHTSDLTVNHHNEITKDKLNKLIENNYSSDVKFNPSLAYRTIFDEVNRRNNIEKDINSFEELIKYKAISREDFEKMLNIVVSVPNKLEMLKTRVFNSLDALGINVFLRKKLVEAWKDAEIQYLTINNVFFFKCIEIIKNSIDTNLESLQGDTFESLEIIYTDITSNKTIKEQKIFNEYFLKAIILKEFYDE
ncbi:dsDNA nuclease domain-containing protein [Chryseobacterium gambrini]|uniref:DsDNA nuclease domain-containing protein n=1 Tax=Chryseobacterium gambrini TaxID=373672 RepID=A0AAJ1R1R1_9FLAO|nr:MULTISPECIES: dsDNA nuclease domain-containing protein [Chryseobacterium]MDN4011998.1 dsDNA nuclease domain-containing protein [Chryseobacterium gambrini]MDQ0066773.1 hypothetical protein [Chryseobacterium lathyri]QWA36948.1 DUF4297 domain-containing protein [Chryseobacterium sp. ZHDP1]